VQLDPRDFEVALERAQADLAASQAQLEAAGPQVPITKTSVKTAVSTSHNEIDAAQATLGQTLRDRDAAEAPIREGRAKAVHAQLDQQRYRYLARENAVPRAQYDEKLAAAKASAASVDSARAEAKAANQRVEQAQARVTEAEHRAKEATNNAPEQVA